MIPFTYAYLLSDVFLSLIWVFLYWKRKDLRREMIDMSMLTLFWVAVSYVFFAKDFLDKVWVSEGVGTIMFFPKGIHWEDIVFTFVLGGIAAVLYEEILGKKHFKKFRRENNFIHYLLFPIIIFLSLFIGIKIFSLNPYYAGYIGFLISAVCIWIIRRDLFIHSLLSGMFLAIIYFLFIAGVFIPLFPGIIQKWWHLSALSGVLVLGVPLEEILWSFFFGLFIGPSYEFLTGLRDRK